MNFKEFPTIIQAKEYPIHAWLTHPEAPFSRFYKEAEPSEPGKDSAQLELNQGVQYQLNSFYDAPSQSSVTLANTLSKSFIDICHEFRLSRP